MPRFGSHRLQLARLASLALAAFAASALRATPPSWAGGSSNKASNPANWVVGNVALSNAPGSSDQVVISTGSVTIDTSNSYGALTFSGGNINGTGTTLTLGTVAASNWTGGSLTFSSGGGIVINSGATFGASGIGSDHDFNGTAITNNGTINWSAGQFRTGSNGAINNNGTFTDTASDNISNALGGSATFSNAGTYQKSGGGTTNIGLTFSNTGTVNVGNGTLLLSGGGSNASGAKINLSSGAGLAFGGGNFNFNSAADIVDAGGTVSFTSGSVAFAGGSTTVGNVAVSGGSVGFTSGGISSSSLSVSSGTVASGSYTTSSYSQTGGSVTGAAVTVTGSGAVWSGGDMNGNGNLTIANSASLTINGSSTHDFSQHGITNNGNLTWSVGQLRTGSNGAINNNGTFTDTASDNISNALGGSATFSNAGTYQKSGGGTTNIGLTFSNTGTVNVGNGTLLLSGGGSNASGAKINLSSGAGLAFGGGNFNFNSAADIVDAGGTVSFTSGSVAFAAGSTTVGNVAVSGGSVGFTSGGISSSSLSVSSGTVASGSYTTSGYSQTGGSVTGAAVTVTGSGAVWSGGDMDGNGNLTIANSASLTINGSSTHDFSQHGITNNGNLTWSVGQLRTGSNGAINNNGTFTDTASDNISNALGGSATFSNAGTYQKSGGGTTNIGLTFSNTGTVNVGNGTLLLSGGGSNASGAKINLSSGAGLAFGGGSFNFNSAADIVDAGGTVSFTSGSVAFAGGSTTVGNVAVSGGSVGFTSGGISSSSLSVSSGTVASGSYTTSGYSQTGGSVTGAAVTVTGSGAVWSGGDMNGNGNLTIANSASLTINGSSTHDFSQHGITNNGNLTWSVGQLRTGSNGAINNNGTFTDTASDNISNALGGSATFSNAGTYQKSGGGTTNIGLTFSNTGTVNVGNGTLLLSGGGSNASGAKINLSSGAGLAFGGGSFNFNSAADIVDAGGTVSFTSGSVAFAGGSTTVGSVAVSGGSVGFTSGGISSSSLSVSSGTVASGSYTTSGYSQTGGSVTGAAVTVTGSGAVWSGGDMNGNGNLTIANSASLTINGSSTHDFSQHGITNNGNLTWSSGQLRTGGGGSFTNNGTFTDNASDAVSNAFGGATLFTNGGTYNKNAAGNTTMAIPFANNGSLNVNTGAFILSGGGSSSAPFTTVVNAITNFANDYTLGNGSGLNGAGQYIHSGGTLNVSTNVGVANLAQSGGTLAPNGTVTISKFDFTGGTIAGSAGGALNITGAMTWTNGSMNGSGTTTIGNGVTLGLDDSTSNARQFSGHAIVNNGTLNWNSAYLQSGDGGSFTNAAGATFNDLNANNYAVNNPFGGTFTFTNNGSYVRNATGATYFDTTFNNNGSVDVRQGNLEIRQGGTLGAGGTITAESSTNVYFRNGYSTTDGSMLQGAGTFWLTGGTFAANGTLSISMFNQTSGGLSGTNAIDGIYNWSGGNWNAPVVTGATKPSTGINAGTTLSLSDANDNARDFNFRDVINHGTVNWNSGYLRSGNGGTFTNDAGGTFNDFNASNYTVNNPFGGAFTFTNNGTYNRKTTGTTYFDTTFDNNGALNLQQGDIQIRQGGTMGSTSVVNAATGTHLYFTNDYTLADGAQFTGTGLFNHLGGTLTINGALTASSFLWSGGNWNVPVTTGAAIPTATVAGTTVLNLTDTNDNTRDFNFRNIVNNGTVNWNSGYLRSGNGGTFTNGNGGTFNDDNTAGYTVNNPFGGTFTFANNGTYVRNATGTTYFDTTFDNNGTLNLQQGDIQLRQGGTMGATSIVNGAAGTHLYFTNNYTLSDGARFAGTGLINQISGTLTINGALRAASFLWSGGNWNATVGSGATSSIATSTVLNLSDANDNARNFNARTIVNDGTVNWNSGYLQSGNSGGFVNASDGTFNDLNAPGYTVNNPFGGTFTFTNNGTYNRNTSGTTYFDTTFDNNGTVSLQQGDIQLRQGGTMGANSVVNGAAGTHLYFTNSYTLADGAQFTGAGLFDQTAGTLTINGSLKASDFLWSGGNWNATTGAGVTTTIANGSALELSDANDSARDFSARAIVNDGTVNWHSGYLRSGNGGSFVNASDGVFNDLNTPGYSVNNPFGGTFTFTNNGTYNKTTTGTTTFFVPFANNGTINVKAGTLAFNGTFTNTGNLVFANGAAAQFAGPITFPSSTLAGTGTLQASGVTAGGLVSPGNSPGALAITGDFTLLSTSALLIELGGTTQGTTYDYLNVGGNVALGGLLDVKFVNGFASSILSTDTFTILSSGGTAGLSGAFANVGSGQRLFTMDGLGSFQVNYGGGLNAVTLSDFQAVPEPSTYALLGVGVLVIGLTLHKRRRTGKRQRSESRA